MGDCNGAISCKNEGRFAGWSVTLGRATPIVKVQAKFAGVFWVSDSIVLVCAVLASLAAGVLVAYAVCQMVFGLMRMRARQAAETSRERTASAARPAEG